MKLNAFAPVALLFTALLATVPGGLFAQHKKVLGKPENYEMPVDYFNQPASLEKFYTDGTKNKSKENAWLVFSDRAKNNVYDKPNSGSSVVGVLDFRQACYVVSEEKEWVEVVDAQVDKLKILNLRKTLGWVPKKKMLLWNSGLVSLGTNIHRKVLLLNRADDINNVVKLEKKEKVSIYTTPDGAGQEPDLNIFDFYFVYKKEGNRMLLCKEAEINELFNDRIVGWVEERRCSPWNNRVCLEPNFSTEGFDERKGNPKFQLKAFGTEEAAADYVNSGVEDPRGIFWKDDVVLMKREKLSKSNPRRFMGNVVRFPMLYKTESGPDDKFFFRSGVIGSIKVRKDGSTNAAGFDSEIQEANYSGIYSGTNESVRKTDHVNVFFVVEGTDGTYGYKNSIVQAMRSVNGELGTGIPDLKYGALVYRDVPERDVTVNGQAANRLVEFSSLTPDFDKVLNFVQAAEFRNYRDQDKFTALYHGLRQALTQGAFRENELNIIVIIGSYGDFRGDPDRKKQAIKDKEPAYVDDLNPLVENLARIDAHLYAVQLRNDGDRASEAFAKQTQFLILETAKYAYSKFYGNKGNAKTSELLNRLSKDHGVGIGEPSMADYAETNNDTLAGGRFPGALNRSSANSNLSTVEVSQVVKRNVKNSLDFERMFKRIVDEVFSRGSDLNREELEADLKVDIGRFMPAFADMLNEILTKDGAASKDLYNSLDEKYKLFAEVYLPYSYREARSPATSFVLFMPEAELYDYKRIIERLISDPTASYSKRREKMFEVYIELITQFSGETGLRNRKPEEITRDEVSQLMQGLYGSGLRLNVALDFRIGDLRDEKKVSNDEIDALMRRFKDVEAYLDKALRDGAQYDFCYESEAGNRYYWIDLQEAF